MVKLVGRCMGFVGAFLLANLLLACVAGLLHARSPAPDRWVDLSLRNPGSSPALVTMHSDCATHRILPERLKVSPGQVLDLEWVTSRKDGPCVLDVSSGDRKRVRLTLDMSKPDVDSESLILLVDPLKAVRVVSASATILASE